jgi:hypothetical protein
MLQSILWIILALVHALPALAFFRPTSLTTLYRIEPDNPLFLLMQHRAGLFLAVFLAALWAAYDPASRKLATIVVGISMVSFLILWLTKGMPSALRQIAVVDLAALPILIAAGWLAWRP